eukprot:TRINITY_DN29773_c0_g1_i1.p1 TRINITY_DN29773_c0_g1~~TRINITY_DN29773_c0_g1_i1.p1  ORF type:complete len:188 (-),score=31.67 TRINITY_DN29773_c0_g1_i1:197-760(-)
MMFRKPCVHTKMARLIALVALCGVLVLQVQLVFTVCSVTKRQRRQLQTMCRGWADPNWNWGSPVGEAHDLAMQVRARLSSEEIRRAWLSDVVDGTVDVEDIKLALGLRIQHAARQGMDGNGAGWQLMQDMAACKYEGQDGVSKLQADLENLASKLPAAEAETRTEGDALGLSAARALTGMGFIEGGC